MSLCVKWWWNTVRRYPATPTTQVGLHTWQYLWAHFDNFIPSGSQTLIQCRFAYEHPNLLLRDEPESKDLSLASDSDSWQHPPTKKCKQKAGHSAGNNHFWGQLDKWFVERIVEWGQFSSELWKQYVIASPWLVPYWQIALCHRYVDETIKLDREMFKSYTKQASPSYKLHHNPSH